VRPSPAITNLDYHQNDPLAGLSLEGASLDAAPWHVRRAVSFANTGVIELELDLPVLTQARPDFGDLRLMRTGKQVPYVLERSRLSRSLPLTLTPVPDAKHPSLSRWKIDLGRAGLPLVRVALNSPTPLFDRHFRLFEQLTDNRGEHYEQSLAAAEWMRRPGEANRPLNFFFNSRPQTSTLWLETDNGDNPPIVLERAEAFHPVTRVLFKTVSTEPITLLYGNADASTPHYDLGLVASQLLSADKQVGKLDTDNGAETPAGSSFLKSASGGIIFWGALAVVVVLLLVVVAKLLPKPPA
jgi:hypothetical protein